MPVVLVRVVMDYTFTEKKFNAAFSVTRESLLDSMRELEWLKYEVAPEWRRFCSFGPEDIGSVWETIGAIRKRPQYSMAVMSQKMLDAINSKIERDVLFGGAENYSMMSGIRIEVSPFLSGNTGYLVADK